MFFPLTTSNHSSWSGASRGDWLQLGLPPKPADTQRAPMSTDSETEPGDDAGIDPNALRDSEDRISPLWLERLRAYLAAGRDEDVATVMEPLHAADIGDVLEVARSPTSASQLVQLLGDQFDYSALTEVDESVRIELMEELPNADIARGVADLDNDDAVYILEDIEQADREEILAKLPAFERLSLKRSLDFPEDSAGRRMQTDFIAIPPFWTVGQTIDYLRAREGPARRVLPDLRRRRRPTTCSAPSRSTSSCAPSATARSSDLMNTNVDRWSTPTRTRKRRRATSSATTLSKSAWSTRTGGWSACSPSTTSSTSSTKRPTRTSSCSPASATRRFPTTSRYGAQPRRLAGGQPRHRGAGVVRHRPVRRHHRADGGAGGADADRRLDGRQCRHADHDGHGAGARHARARRPPTAPADRPRDDGRRGQRRASSPC